MDCLRPKWARLSYVLREANVEIGGSNITKGILVPNSGVKIVVERPGNKKMVALPSIYM